MLMNKQHGFSPIYVILILVIFGAIGFVALRVVNPSKFEKQAATQTGTASKAKTTKEESTDTTGAKTLKVVTSTDEVRTYTLTYPFNENNKNVIQEAVKNNSLGNSKISFKPVRDYFNTVSAASNDCKYWAAGYLRVGRVQDLFGDSSPEGNVESQAGKEQQLAELVTAGKAVQLSDDVYALAPSKQNEPCTDIYESNDPALKTALQETDKIQAAWLKSLKLQN